jgi:hypothetical protein
MTQLLDRRVQQPVRHDEERLARRDLRRQIARLENELGALFQSAFPRQGIEWSVPGAAGPRLLGVAELERIRDGLVGRVHAARDELAARAHVEEGNRELLRQMIAAPERYRWLRISRQDIGETGCGHWHSRPVLGPVGMVMKWWRVKVSSGCP